MHAIHETASICRSYLNAPDDAIALVTLVDKTGSSYRQPGARMIVLRDGTTVGSISGGCLESDLAITAKRMHAEGERFRLETIDTRPLFGCPGKITLFLESIRPARSHYDHWMGDVDQMLKTRQCFSLATCWDIEADAPGTRIGQTQESAPQDKVLLQKLMLRERVIVIGAHADVDPLLQAITLLGWETIQVIPGSQRQSWIYSGSGTPVYHLGPEALVDRFKPDAATAIVIMTHNIGRDIAYAAATMKHDYPYIGMLGSLRRRQEVLDHLLEADALHSTNAMERLHCPIGLDLGPGGPGTIALSIAAEIMAFFSNRTPSNLRGRATAIHSDVAFS